MFCYFFWFLSDLEGSRSPCIRNRLEQFHIRRLETLKFWLLHAIGSIHTYLAGQVLQSLSFILEKALAQADSLDMIISGNTTRTDRFIFLGEKFSRRLTIDRFAVHNEYLNKVYEHCLLTEAFEDLMTTINNVRRYM